MPPRDDIRATRTSLAGWHDGSHERVGESARPEVLLRRYVSHPKQKVLTNLEDELRQLDELIAIDARQGATGKVVPAQVALAS